MMISGILLAAGNSSRFGADKLLHPLPDGTPMALAAARNLLAAVPHAVAVVRPGAEQLAQQLRDTGMTVTFCSQCEHGMGASLSCGIAAAASAQGWLIALADMPWIRCDTLNEVARLLAAGAPIAAPFYRGQRGHPVGFSSVFLEPLSDLRGDRGARDLLTRHADRIVTLDCDDPGILRDIDTPRDLVEHTIGIA